MNIEVSPDELLQAVALVAGQEFVQRVLAEARAAKLQATLQTMEAMAEAVVVPMEASNGAGHARTVER